MLFNLYMQSKDRLFFTRFITSNFIKPSQLETKNIISEFHRYLTLLERSEDSNFSSEDEEANLDQHINFSSDLLSVCVCVCVCLRPSTLEASSVWGW